MSNINWFLSNFEDRCSSASTRVEKWCLKRESRGSKLSSAGPCQWVCQPPPHIHENLFFCIFNPIGTPSQGSGINVRVTLFSEKDGMIAIKVLKKNFNLTSSKNIIKTLVIKLRSISYIHFSLPKFSQALPRVSLLSCSLLYRLV